MARFFGMNFGKLGWNDYNEAYNKLSKIYNGDLLKDFEGQLKDFNMDVTRLVNEPDNKQYYNSALGNMKVCGSYVEGLRDSLNLLRKKLKKCRKYKNLKKSAGSETITVEEDADNLEEMLKNVKDKELVVIDMQMKRIKEIMEKHSQPIYGPSAVENKIADFNTMGDSVNSILEMTDLIRKNFAEVKGKVDDWGWKQEVYGPGK